MYHCTIETSDGKRYASGQIAIDTDIVPDRGLRIRFQGYDFTALTNSHAAGALYLMFWEGPNPIWGMPLNIESGFNAGDPLRIKFEVFTTINYTQGKGINND